MATPPPRVLGNGPSTATLAKKPEFLRKLIANADALVESQREQASFGVYSSASSSPFPPSPSAHKTIRTRTPSPPKNGRHSPKSSAAMDGIPSLDFSPLENCLYSAQQQASLAGFKPTSPEKPADVEVLDFEQQIDRLIKRMEAVTSIRTVSDKMSEALEDLDHGLPILLEDDDDEVASPPLGPSSSAAASQPPPMTFDQELQRKRAKIKALLRHYENGSSERKSMLNSLTTWFEKASENSAEDESALKEAEELMHKASEMADSVGDISSTVSKTKEKMRELGTSFFDMMDWMEKKGMTDPHRLTSIQNDYQLIEEELKRLSSSAEDAAEKAKEADKRISILTRMLEKKTEEVRMIKMRDDREISRLKNMMASRDSGWQQKESEWKEESDKLKAQITKFQTSNMMADAVAGPGLARAQEENQRLSTALKQKDSTIQTLHIDLAKKDSEAKTLRDILEGMEYKQREMEAADEKMRASLEEAEKNARWMWKTIYDLQQKEKPKVVAKETRNVYVQTAASGEDRRGSGSSSYGFSMEFPDEGGDVSNAATQRSMVDHSVMSTARTQMSSTRPSLADDAASSSSRAVTPTKTARGSSTKPAAKGAATKQSKKEKEKKQSPVATPHVAIAERKSVIIEEQSVEEVEARRKREMEMESKAQSQQQRISEMAEMVSEAEEKAENADREAQALKRQLSEAAFRSEKEMKTLADQHDAEMQELRIRCADLEDIETSLRQTVAELEDDLRELTNSLQEKTAKYQTDLMENAASEKSSVTEFKAREDELTKTCAMLRKDVSEKEQELERMADKLAESESQRRQMESSVAMMEEQMTSFMSMSGSVDQVMLKMKTDLVDLAKVKSENADLHLRLKEHDAVVQEMKERVRKNKEEVRLKMEALAIQQRAEMEDMKRAIVKEEEETRRSMMGEYESQLKIAKDSQTDLESVLAQETNKNRTHVSDFAQVVQSEQQLRSELKLLASHLSSMLFLTIESSPEEDFASVDAQDDPHSCTESDTAKKGMRRDLRLVHDVMDAIKSFKGYIAQSKPEPIYLPSPTPSSASLLSKQHSSASLADASLMPSASILQQQQQQQSESAFSRSMSFDINAMQSLPLDDMNGDLQSMFTEAQRAISTLEVQKEGMRRQIEALQLQLMQQRRAESSGGTPGGGSGSIVTAPLLTAENDPIVMVQEAVFAAVVAAEVQLPPQLVKIKQEAVEVIQKDKELREERVAATFKKMEAKLKLVDTEKEIVKYQARNEPVPPYVTRLRTMHEKAVEQWEEKRSEIKAERAKNLERVMRALQVLEQFHKTVNGTAAVISSDPTIFLFSYKSPNQHNSPFVAKPQRKGLATSQGPRDLLNLGIQTSKQQGSMFPPLKPTEVFRATRLIGSPSTPVGSPALRGSQYHSSSSTIPTMPQYYSRESF